MDIRKIMDKWSVQQKKGLLTDAEIQKLVTEWQDECGEEELEQTSMIPLVVGLALSVPVAGARGSATTPLLSEIASSAG